MKSIGSSISSVGKRLTLGVTLPLAAAGAASFKMADDFETSLSRVVGLAGKTQKQVDAWGKELIRLGPKLGKGPRELAEALYFVASSGIPAAKTMETVTAAAKASEAGLGDTKIVADALTSAMNAYGASNMSAAHAADVLVATVREGKGEAADFAPIIGNVTAYASRLGVSFEEVGAALAAMTQLGTDAATAGTQLMAFFSQTLRVTGPMQKAADEVGFSFERLRDALASGDLQGGLKYISDFAKQHGGIDTLATIFPNIRALRGVLALVGDEGNRVSGIFKRMGESSGSLATAFEAAQKRSGYSMDKFRASVEALGIAIGTILAPIVAKVAEHLTRLSIAFQNLDPEMQKLIIGVAAFAAVVGPILIVVGSLVGAIGALAPVFVALASPLGLVVAALIALGVALAAAVLWPDKLQAALERMGMSTKSAKETVEALQNAFTAIRAVALTVWPSIQGMVMGAMKVIEGVLNIVSGILRGDFSQAWLGMKQVVSGVLQGVIGLITYFPRLVLAGALAIGAAIVEGIGQGLRALPELIRQSIGKIPGLLVALAVFAAGAASRLGEAIVNGIVAGLAGLFEAVKNKIIGGIQGAIDAALGIFGHSPQKAIGIALATEIIAGWQEASSAMPQKMADKVREAIRAAQQAISSEKGNVASAMSALVDAALAAFDRLSSQIMTKSEKALAKLQAAEEKRRLVEATAEARAALAAAQQALAALAPKEGETPEEFAARVQAAQQAVVDAQKQLDAALLAQQEYALQQRAAKERAALDAKRERQRVALENELQAAQNAYNRGAISLEQYNQRVLNILAKYGIPYKKAAGVLGAALAEGLHDAFADVQKAAKALANVIIDELAKIRVIVNVDLQVKNPTPPKKRQFGGAVFAGHPYIVGEAGPEIFWPSTSGKIVPNASHGSGFGGGITVNVYNAGSVISERELIDSVRDGLLAKQRQIGSLGFA